MRKFSPQFKQFSLVLFVTLIISLQAMMMVVRMIHDHQASKAKTASTVAWQIVEISRMVLATPVSHQRYAIRNINKTRITTDHALLEVSTSEKPLFAQRESIHQDLLKLHAQLIEQKRPYHISLSLTPTRWVNFKETGILHFPKFQPTLLILEIMALLCLWWLTFWKWRLLRPITHLTRLAKKLTTSAPMLSEDIINSPSEIQEMGSALVQMQEQVKELLRQRSLLLGLTSHDLGAILTRIKMRIELQGESPEREKLLDNIAAMTKLLDQMLSYSHEHQNISQQEDINLTQLLHQIVKELTPRKTQINTQHIKADLHLQANRVMLKMALHNLVENAVKYGEHVTIQAFSNDNETVIIVFDDGPGIANAERDHVFDANFRGSNHNKPGIGLGLTFAKNVITDLHGKIKLQHNKPKGLKLIISFYHSH